MNVREKLSKLQQQHISENRPWTGFKDNPSKRCCVWQHYVCFFQIHLFDWQCHRFETQVSHNCNMSARPACVCIYTNIICPTPLHIERYTKSLCLETFYSLESWVFRWTPNRRITLKSCFGSIGFGQPVFTDCDLFYTFKVNQGAKYTSKQCSVSICRN